MKHTSEQLSMKENYQINRILAELLGFDIITHHCVGDEIFMESRWVDYCQNPNDIIPLQIEHKIELDFHGVKDIWVANIHSNQYVFVLDKNPLRAISECLILKLEGEL